jgi:hypothetical protein
VHRSCTRCARAFTAADFVRGESRNLEADRQALGLEGVRFLYYACPACGQADLFLDLHHLPGESEEDFAARRREMEEAVRQARPAQVEVVLVER